MKYKITISPTEVTDPGSLQFLSRITDDYQAEYIDTDENGNEVHELEVTDEYADWVEQQLDTSDGIISYQEVKE
ncbi:hypothetical protein LCGC14_2097240 [marine sediment metagenome]|uniref:Uncharacterized protein n=1 Tax=marine sediment metagenome TaxID=412755 RepID=A0A0F9EY76_9ZZZZ